LHDDGGRLADVVGRAVDVVSGLLSESNTTSLPVMSCSLTMSRRTFSDRNCDSDRALVHFKQTIRELGSRGTVKPVQARKNRR